MKKTFTRLLIGFFFFLGAFLPPWPNVAYSAARPIYHRVKPKENLFRISLKYHSTQAQLQAWNNIKNAGDIKIGQVLLVARGAADQNTGTNPQIPFPVSEATVSENIPLSTPADSTFLPEKEVLQPSIKSVTAPERLLSGINHAGVRPGTAKAGFISLPAYPEQLDVKTIFISVMVVLFTALAIGLFLFVISSRIYKIYCAFLAKRLRKKYELLLMDVLFNEENSEIDTNRISDHFKKNYLQRKFNRQILLTEIIHLHKNFSGDFAQNLEMFYTRLGFHQDSFDKLSSTLWHIKAQGISELAEMNIKTTIPTISKFIEHPNELLRMEAQLAVLRLADQDVLGFLDHLQSPLTDWQQLNLQQVLSHKDRDQIPEFSRWLTSANDSIIEFSVKMIGLYNQVTAVPQLIKLLRSGSLKIKIAAVQSLQKLDASAALPELEAIYHWETNKDLRLLIIQAMENIGFDDVNFYEQAISTGDFDISLAAAKAMLAFKEAGSDYFAQLRLRADERLNSILAHVLDTRI